MGITILTAAVLFVMGIVWLKGISFKPNTFEAQIVFKNTTGLQIGDAVTRSGFKVGKVTDIVLEEDSVVVYASLSNNVNLRKDASARITSVDFFGGKRIEINPGKSSTAFDVESPLYGTREPDITELTAQLRAIAEDVRGTLDKVDSVLININGIVGDKSVVTSIKRAVYNLDSTTVYVKRIVAKSDSKIDSSLSRLMQSTRMLRALVEKSGDRLDTAFASVRLVTNTIAHTTATLDTIVSKVRSGEGNLGKMIYDESIYDRLESATVKFDSLLNVLHQKGFKVDVKLFGD